MALTTEVTARPHEILEDVGFGDDTGCTFTAGPLPDLLSAFMIEDEDERTMRLWRAKYNWVRDGFEAEDWAHFDKRIADPEDPLRTEHVLALYDVLVAAVTKRPPTSPTGSSRTPRRRDGEDEPKPKDETSGD